MVLVTVHNRIVPVLVLENSSGILSSRAPSYHLYVSGSLQGQLHCTSSRDEALNVRCPDGCNCSERRASTGGWIEECPRSHHEFYTMCALLSGVSSLSVSSYVTSSSSLNSCGGGSIVLQFSAREDITDSG